MDDEFDWDTAERDLAGNGCTLNYRGCGGEAAWMEDPYEADVNNTPGVMVYACEHCIGELAQDI